MIMTNQRIMNVINRNREKEQQPQEDRATRHIEMETKMRQPR